jgi:hypothetical protein
VRFPWERHRNLASVAFAVVVGGLSCVTVGPGDLPHFQYRGRDLVGVTVLDVLGRVQDGTILVRCPRFQVELPYATDWDFTVFPSKILMNAQSKRLKLIASISLDQETGQVEPSRYLERQRDTLAETFRLRDPRVLLTPTPILVYAVGGEPQATNYWAVRQSRRNLVFRLHISSTTVDPSQLRELEQRLAALADRGFKISE